MQDPYLFDIKLTMITWIDSLISLLFFNSFAFCHLLAIVDSSLLISHLCIEISTQPRAPFCLIQSALSFWVPHPVPCSTRLCPCFWNFGPFSLNQFTSICLSVGSLTCHQPIRFFFEILGDFRYVSFLFLSYRVKKHICILWNPNICFKNNLIVMCYVVKIIAKYFDILMLLIFFF